MPNEDCILKSNEAIVDPLIGQILGGRYELLERLGAGGMGTIYRAKHTATDATVAIKLIHRSLISDLKAVARFQQEAKILGQLQHPNIIGIKSIDVDDGMCFFVMEYAAGISLAKSIHDKGRMSTDEFCLFFEQAISGLAYAHAHGVIHRDVKPSNLMLVTMANGQCILKILDFGISKILGASDQMTTESGICLASPQYMSPEQCSGGKADARSDIYSLGCVMFEALSGKPPFTGGSPVEIADKHLSEPVPDFGGKDLRPQMRVIAKCMAKDPDQRYQTMEEVRIALQEGEARSVKLQKLPGQPAKRSMVPLISLAAIATIALGSLGFFALSKKLADDGDMASSVFGGMPPGLVVTVFCDQLNHGQMPPEAEVKKVMNITLHPEDERLRRLAYKALAIYFDRRGDKNERDKNFQAILDLAHKSHESSCLTVESWARCLKRDNSADKAKLVLESELDYAKRHECVGDAMDIEQTLANIDNLNSDQPEL
jgi:hypothetical protein